MKKYYWDSLLIQKKPRTDCEKVRKADLTMVKKRKKPHQLIRTGIRRQLTFLRCILRRNLAHIDRLITVGASLVVLNPREYRTLGQQVRRDKRIRVEVEGNFGQAKQRFGLGRGMTKLAQTTATIPHPWPENRTLELYFRSVEKV